MFFKILGVNVALGGVEGGERVPMALLGWYYSLGAMWESVGTWSINLLLVLTSGHFSGDSLDRIYIRHVGAEFLFGFILFFRSASSFRTRSGQKKKKIQGKSFK